MQAALDTADESRAEVLTEEELRALGTVVTLESDESDCPIALDRLERRSAHRKTPKRPKWLLLSVMPARPDQGLPERATVWVSDEYRAEFLKLFEDYLALAGRTGSPHSNELVANIARIRETVLADLWQSEGQPPANERVWWEIWLRPGGHGPGLLRRFAEANILSSPGPVEVPGAPAVEVVGRGDRVGLLGEPNVGQS